MGIKEGSSSKKGNDLVSEMKTHNCESAEEPYKFVLFAVE